MPEINHKNHKHCINKPPFYGRKIFKFNKQTEKEAFDMINKVRLFRTGFGYSSKNQDTEKYNEMIKTKVEPKYEDMKNNIIENNLIEAVMIYGFYKTITENDKLYIYEFNKNEKIEIPTKRMEREPYNSITDFFNKEEDTIGFSLVSLGIKFNSFLKGLYENDCYRDYYFYNAIGTHIIENYADILQTYMESIFNINNNVRKKHAGCRYSFGYKALPNMYGNRIIFDKLKPEEFNIDITESYMLCPELSTCAVISFCEDSYYFAN